ncbi:MAG: HAMP domain-containing histidine kinase [Deltaproteobacteria bacterium]|nr:HAMP domain-containing histidine kinase [Deltaproteobacteria bacterium]
MPEKPSASSGAVDSLIQRIGNPLEWSPAGKAALACGTCLGLAFSWAVYFYWLVEDSSRAPYMEPQAALFARNLQNAFVVIWAVFLGICLAARSDRLRILGQPLVYLTAQLFTVHTMLVGHAFGLFTAPYGVLFGVCGMLLGVLLMGVRPVSYGVLTGVAIQVLSTIGSQNGWFPYAPLLRGTPVINERLPVSWLVLTGSWVTICQVATMVVGLYILSQWRGRQERLEAAYVLLREQKTQLVRAESLAAVGSLVSGAARELQRPLDFARTSFQKLRTDIAASDAPESQKSEALRIVEMSLKGHERAADIAGRLNSIAEALAPGGESHPLDAVMNLIRSDYPQSVFQVSPQAASVPVNERLVATVLRNLLKNAVAAGGDTPPRVVASLADRFLDIRVSDSGRGIPEAMQSEVFKPFFTGQKAGEGHGLGLGLYIVHELVHRAGGTIDLQSQAGRGTSVSILLPVDGAPHGM